MPRLFEFRFQVMKYGGSKEFLDRDVQTIEDFLDRRNCRALVPSIDNVIHGGLGYAALAAQFVDGNTPFIAQFKYPNSHRVTNRHVNHPLPANDLSYQFINFPLKRLTHLS